MPKKKNIERAGLASLSFYSKVLEYGIALLLILVAFVIVVDVNDNTILKSSVLLIGGSFLVALWLFLQLQRGVILWKKQKFHLPVFIYFFACCISVTQSLNLSLSINALGQFFAIIAVTFITSQVLNERNDFREQLMNVLLFIVAGSCIAGIVLQIYAGVSLTIIADYSRQLISTFGNSAYFGGFLAMMIPFVAGQLFATSSRKKKYILGFLLLFSIVLLVFTRTRSAWIATAISSVFFIFLAFPKNKKNILYFIGVCMLLLLADVFFFHTILQRFENIFQEQSSFSRRLDFYIGSFNAFLSSPIIGKGFGSFEVFYAMLRSNEYWISKSEDVVAHAHNEYLEILSESGAVGMIAFLFVLFVAGKFIFQKLYRDETSRLHRFPVIGIMTGILSILIDNVGNMSLRVVPIRLIFFVLLALLFSYTSEKENEKKILIPSALQKFSFVPLLLFLALLFYFIPKEIHRYKGDKLYLLGYRYDLEGNTRSSFTAYQMAYKENPEHPLILFHCAGTAYQTNNYALAFKQTSELLNNYPGYPKANLIQALVLYQRKDYINAINSVKKELTLRNHPQTYQFIARLYSEINDTNNEIDAHKKNLSICLKSKNDESVAASLIKLSTLMNSNELKQLPLFEIEKNFYHNKDIVSVMQIVKEKIGSANTRK
ncbi:MAG: O-antigen ligase family protein [Bacteroidota bacterium]